MTSVKEAYELRITREMLRRDPESKAERIADFILSASDSARTLSRLLMAKRSSPTASPDLDATIEYVRRNIEQHFKNTFGVVMFPETE